MKRFEQILNELKLEMHDMTFSETVREARDRLGLLQYRAAQHMKMPMPRLKNLETGYFRDMPTTAEINEICDFYELPRDKMVRKAQQHILKHVKRKKIRTIHD